MTPEQFNALLDAYGTDFRRWPEAERAPARAFALQDRPEWREPLAEAALLDDWLDQYTVAAPDEQLMRRVVASATAAARPGLAAPKKPWRQLRWWWPGAGLAGIGLAGTLAGVFAVSIALRSAAPPTPLDLPERSTAFSQMSPDWSGE
ncbi:hypothetical protein [Variovorax terrae]|uniref:Uncharacterized protein n=1 Tax=Variovorax terrae TaxID=2923278 RepID=A0A9X1VW53_9BURK|nr:hypothetical protein [Variovorax terrae]MCJ0764487.1 hypothetical protein [Variovorax terrae]